MSKINVTAVSYLNTKPLLNGIFHSPVADQINLQLDIPSVCAEKLRSGEADLGLVPVAIIPELQEAHIVSDFCIGTVGAVKTVAIYSDIPIEQLEAIYLDYHSKTSVALTKLLIRDYWQLDLALLPAESGYIDAISEKTGGLVIGDRTIGLEQRFSYVYDLGAAWMAHTGLPFVFAAWVSNQPLSAPFLNAFNAALKKGIELIPQLMYLLPSPHPDFDLKEYFTKHISYELDEAKKKALEFFLKAIKSRSEVVVGNWGVME